MLPSKLSKLAVSGSLSIIMTVTLAGCGDGGNTGGWLAAVAIAAGLAAGAAAGSDEKREGQPAAPTLVNAGSYHEFLAAVKNRYPNALTAAHQTDLQTYGSSEADYVPGTTVSLWQGSYAMTQMAGHQCRIVAGNRFTNTTCGSIGVVPPGGVAGYFQFRTINVRNLTLSADVKNAYDSLNTQNADFRAYYGFRPVAPASTAEPVPFVIMIEGVVRDGTKPVGNSLLIIRGNASRPAASENSNQLSATYPLQVRYEQIILTDPYKLQGGTGQVSDFDAALVKQN